MKNKIVLVDVQEEKEPYLEVPLGFLSIGTILKNNKYDVKIIKVSRGNIEKIDNYIDEKVLCVGFGVKTDQVETALKISEHIKNKYEDIKIVWGGIHVNLYPEQVLENSNIDVAVIGDGEYTMLEIAKVLQKNKSFQNIKGCGYKNNGKMIFNKKREFTDISKIPATDYSILMEIEKYIEGSKCADAIMENTAFFPILCGVGCPFNCSFCYNTTQKGRISKRDANVMLDEIKYLQKNYDVNFFRLRDELFFYDKKKVEEFIKEKKKRKLKFLWDSSFHINILKDDKLYSDSFLEELKQEGFAYTGVGVESGAIPQLKRYRKNISPDDVIKVVRRLKKLRLLSTYAFMVGAPNETYDDMIDTIKLIYKIKSISPKYAYITGPLSLFRPYPGADLYKEAVKLGYKERKSLKEWKNLSSFTGYNTYKDFPYLKTNLKKIFNIFYYLKLIRGLFEIDNKYLNSFLSKEIIYKFMTDKNVINTIGLILRSFVENKIIDKFVIQKILHRSLILEK